MKLFANSVIVILVLCTVNIFGQISQSEDHAILEVNELSSHQNETDYRPLLFNYHEYEEVNLEEFSKSYHIDDVKKHTFFAVFSYSGTNDLFQVHSDDKVVKVSNQLVEGRQKIGIEIDEGFSHMLFYSGSSGRKTNEEITSRMRIGHENMERGQGTINLAELCMYDKVLTKEELRIKQSHFAIKYGISLPKDSSYVSAEGEIIYNADFHEGFNYRVIALAHTPGLNVSQTTHHRNHFLEFGLNEINPIQKRNKAELENNSYIFIGDNGGNTLFEDNMLNRKWRLSSNNPQSNKSSFCFKISIEDITDFDDSFDYFLMLSKDTDFDEEEDKSIKLNQIGRHLIVNGTSLLDLGQQYFSISRRPKVIVNKMVRLRVDNLQMEGREINAQLSSSEKELHGDLNLYTLDGFVIDRTEVNASFEFQKKYFFKHPGLYFLSYISGETHIVKKIVIQ